MSSKVLWSFYTSPVGIRTLEGRLSVLKPTDLRKSTRLMPFPAAYFTRLLISPALIGCSSTILLSVCVPHVEIFLDERSGETFFAAASRAFSSLSFFIGVISPLVL